MTEIIHSTNHPRFDFEAWISKDRLMITTYGSERLTRAYRSGDTLASGMQAGAVALAYAFQHSTYMDIPDALEFAGHADLANRLRYEWRDNCEHRAQTDPAWCEAEALLISAHDAARIVYPPSSSCQDAG